ncbi:MAG: amino acid adenylation domain-containing protein, partial [Chromatiales bacterium]
MKQKTTIDTGETSSARLLIAQSPLLTSDKGKAPLIDRSTAAANYPRDLCIHQLFEAQVKKTPDATALVFEHVRLTYRELNTRANRLAHYLQSLGVGAEVLVALCIERSIDLIVGQLAILKAGGAYLPLDPAYPKERLAFMLRDSKAKVLINQVKCEGELVEHHVRGVFIDRPEALDQYPSTNPETATAPDNLAYVIYTSGSTGIPKGVQIEHGGLSNLIAWHHRTYDVGATDRATQVAGIGFDASVLEIWPYLTAGASIHIPDEEIRSVPRKLVDWLAAERITLCFLPTPLAEIVLDEPWPKELALRALLTGGDRLHRAPRQALPFALINHYGPTEYTVVTTCAEVVGGDVEHRYPPIGCPIDNTQVHILDPQLNPTPIGVPGELHIDGAGLARGYLNRPELTAEKFIANPFSDAPNARMYKTGDLGRYLPDGNIEFLGRLDDQVKIRGFRVELGEIEAVLSDHPECKQAVVIARDETSSDPSVPLVAGKRLVAYVVVSGERRDSLIARLRDYLQGKLPDYMRPSAFVLLDRLPLTANGKVDRKALPAPDHSRPDVGDTFVAPRNSLEGLLASIYSEVLNIKPIGIHDNFLNLGGHSLLAAQVVARVREALQMELPVRLLLEGSSVSALAAKLDASKPKKYVPLMRVARDGDLPVSFSQERAWFIQQLDPTSIAYHFQATFRFTGQLDCTALERSLSEIVRRHEVLRTSFPEVNGRAIQVIHDAEAVSVPVSDLQRLPQAERETAAQRIIETEIRKRFDLAQLPLIRWVLIRLAVDEHILLQIEHHLVHDGWSYHVFLGELLDLYKAFTAGKPSPLPELPIQFADFAIAQRRWMEGEEAAAQLAYWKRRLSGAAALAWRSDRPRPPQQTFVGAAPRIELPLELCAALRALSRRRGVTLFMTMFAGFLIVLQRYTAQDDVCVGSGIANRRWRETEGMIGMMLNNIVLRNDLSGDPDFDQLLRRVQQTSLDAYANQDLPFDQVVSALEQTRDASRNPLFQVMYSFHDAPFRGLDFPKLRTRLLSQLSNGSAKFDLNVIVIPYAEQRVGQASVEGAGGTTLIWEYNSDLFDEATMTRMIGHYQKVLQGIVADQTMRISELPLISPSERAELIKDWNANCTAYPDHHAVAELFEEQVARNPDAVALIFEGAQLSYRELNEQANQLAHHLIARGVGPEVLVALCFNRSSELIVTLLAILKAGGAYLVLDPDYPKERLSFMLEDGRVSIVITTRALSPALPELPGERVLLDQPGSFEAYSSANPEARASPDNLAYVIYTSGSTGAPKGVTIPHRGVIRLVKNTNYADFNSTDIFL